MLAEFGFERIAFADKLKDLAYEIDPFLFGYYLSDAVNREGWDRAKRQPSVREFLQNLGTAGRKVFGEDFWVQQALSTAIPAEARRVVITDVRYPNEADAIRNLGGKIWRIERYGVEAVNGHISETAMSGYAFDAHIINNSSIDSLRDSVMALLKQEGGTFNF